MMESFGGLGFSGMNNTVRKKRSNPSRRLQNDNQPDYAGKSSLLSSTPSDSGSKGSSDVNTGLGSNYHRKELNLNQCNSRASYADFADTEEAMQSEIISDKKGNDSTVKKENSDEDHSSSLGKGSDLRGIPWKDFSRSGFRVGKSDSSRGMTLEESLSARKSVQYESVRKSKRVPKRQLLDGAFGDEEEDDDEMRYLEKIKTSKTSAACGAEYDDEDEVRSRKHRKISGVLSRTVDVGYNVNVGSYASSGPGKESKKFKAGKESVDTDYLEEDEYVSDGEPEVKRKKQTRVSSREMVLTRRRRSLQSGEESSYGSGAVLVEFPNVVPPAPPRGQKDELSEVEQQLKKAEAAQRRRMQAEKAARELEAEAIRKILGQDSSRKKREKKTKQRQEELAQERTANATKLASNTVRWIIGPTGTVVIFPGGMGLPTIFEPKPCSYPPPREKCAGPSCSNPYKYRDSRSKLPLCSLQCYKAVN